MTGPSFRKLLVCRSPCSWFSFHLPLFLLHGSLFLNQPHPCSQVSLTPSLPGKHSLLGRPHPPFSCRQLRGCCFILSSGLHLTGHLYLVTPQAPQMNALPSPKSTLRPRSLSAGETSPLWLPRPDLSAAPSVSCIYDSASYAPLICPSWLWRQLPSLAPTP